MKRIIGLILLAGLLSSCTTSKRLSYLEMPALPEAPEPVDVAAIETEYGNYDGVFLDYQQIIEHSGTKEDLGMLGTQWSYTRIWKRRFVVLNTEADWLTTFSVYGKPAQLYMRVITPDGTVSDYGFDDLEKDFDEDGDEMWTLVYPNIVKGTIIEEGMEFNSGIYGYAPPLDHDIPLRFRIPCQKLEVSFAYPSWWDIKVKRIGDHRVLDYQMIENLEAKKNILSYKTTDIPALRREPYSPSFKSVAPYLQFMVTDLKMGKGRLDLPEMWSDLAKRYAEAYLSRSDKTKLDSRLGKQFFSEPEIKSIGDLVGAITKDIEPGPAQLDTIMGFIRQNVEIKYKGKDGNCPKMLKDGEGNVYDITLMARNMFREAGYDADFILVHDENDGYFDSDYIGYDQFYQAAVRVQTEEAVYVAFPYEKDFPVTFIPTDYLGQPSLVIKKDTLSSFWQVPDTSVDRNVFSLAYDIEITPAGEVLVTEHHELLGQFAYMTRPALKNLEGEDLEKTLQDFITYTGGEVDFISHDILNLNDYRQPLILDLKYSVGNLVTVVPGEVLFQTAGLFSPISYHKYRLELEERTNPIAVFADEEYVKNIAISYPDNWIITNRPVDVAFDNEFGSIKTAYTVSTGALDADLRLKLTRTVQPKESYPAFLELRGTSKALQVPTIIFEVQEI